MVYILDRYEYGRKAYNEGAIDYSHLYLFPKSFNNKLACITYYLKKIGKSDEYILGYMKKFLDDSMEDETGFEHLTKEVKIAKNYKLNIVKNELAKEYNEVKFSKKEIELIKSVSNTMGKVLFSLMCVNKLYGYKFINIKDRCIQSFYNDSIYNRGINDQIYYLIQRGYFTQKMLYGKRKYDLVCSLVLTDKLLSLYNEDEVVYTFDNLGNLSLLFNYIVGKETNVIFCSHCGKITERTGRSTKYCKECAYEINLQKTKKNMKNLRKSKMFDS